MGKKVYCIITRWPHQSLDKNINCVYPKSALHVPDSLEEHQYCTMLHKLNILQVTSNPFLKLTACKVDTGSYLYHKMIDIENEEDFWWGKVPSTYYQYVIN